MEIRPILIPRSVIREIPPPVVDATAPPVTRGIKVPVVNVPTPVIEYPTLDAPTQEQFEGMRVQPQQPEPEPEVDTRDLPPPPPQVNLPVVGPVDLPPVAPLITAGATAVVTTAAALGATIIFGQVKQAAEPMIRSALERTGKKKKVKIKQVKPVLHFVHTNDGVDILQYSKDGTKVVGTTTDIEKYLRDQVDTDSLYEYDNKIIIDENIKSMFTKEGTKRFKRHFVPPAKIAKKLAARITF